MSFWLIVFAVLLLLSAGFFAGLLGIGGGLFLVPFFQILIKDWGISESEGMKILLANALCASFINAAIGSVYILRKGYEIEKKVFLLVLGAMVSSFLTTYSISHGNWYSEKLFTVVFSVLLVLTGLRMIFKVKVKERTGISHKAIKMIGIGVISGSVAALSGLGGGVIIVPLLTLILGFDMRLASKMSTLSIPFLLLPSLLLYFFSSSDGIDIPTFHWGYILPTYQLLIFGVAFFMAPLGVRIAQKSDIDKVRTIFAIILLIASVKYILKIF